MSTRKKALELLKECLGEIAKLRGRGYDAPEFGLWYDKVKAILEGAFTQADCRKFLHSWPTYNGLSSYASQKEYRKFLKKCETDLKWIIQKYEIRDKLSSEGECTLSLQLFNAMQFHPKVVNASKSLFETGHYAQAIFEAFKAVNNFVKEKTSRTQDGKDLMAKVFNENTPIIKLNELLTQSDKDEQEGFRFLFMGAMVGIRNPKAHDNVIQNDPYETLEYLGLASLLMRRVEEGAAVKTRPTKINEKIFLERCREGGHERAIELYFKVKASKESRRNNGDFINWGVSGYSYNIAWKDNPAGVLIFVSSAGGSLSLWLYLIERSGEAGQKYLQNLRKIADFGSKVDDYRKHKEPSFSTDEMTEVDINAFISAIEELGLALEVKANK